MADVPVDKSHAQPPAESGVVTGPGEEVAASSPAQPQRPSQAPDEPEIVDVWSRTEPKYRKRAVALLIINIVLFCGLCVFTFWLREARAYDFSFSSYVAPAVFWSAGPSLNDFLFEPIDILRTPAHAIVLGLLIGAMAAVPIVVAILYRFRCALPFVAAVLVFAHMPWLMFTLLWSCVLAAVRPFRMKFRFGSALVGLLPVLLYLYLAAKGTTEFAAASPAQKTWLVAPWVLAVLAASAMIAITLQLARVVNYRPGSVAPVVAVMFATPVFLFHVQVGVDELNFGVLRSAYGPRSQRFVPTRDAKPQLHDLVRTVVNDDALYQTYLPELLAALRGERVSDSRLILHYFQVNYLADRAAAYEACREFIADHPRSRYVASVLYMQAWALDGRLQEQKLLLADPRRELYFDFPHVQSEPVWAALLSEHPDSPFAAAASLRLAQLLLRQGEVDRALKLLEQPHARPETDSAAPATQPSDDPFLAAETPERTLGFDAKPYRLETWRLREWVVANRNDPKFGNEPIRECVSLDPRRARYLEQLLRLAEKYRGGLLEDNLVVNYVVALPDRTERRIALEQLVTRLPQEDALPEALFHLAALELHAGVDDPKQRSRSMERLRTIVTEDHGTYWAAEAAKLLAAFEPRKS